MERLMYRQAFEELVQIMHRLRRECPWDREQTPQSLRQYILEEAFETVETIDDENWGELRKELGDLLLQVVFQAEIAQEEQRFTLQEVIEGISRKLIERHPHVFGDTVVENAGEVRENWEQIKFKSEKRTSLLQGVPRHIPALLRAQRIQDKASQAGFDWDNADEVLDKIHEETAELKAASTPQEVEDEMGDLLFSLVNYCRFRQLNAEDALRRTTARFTQRFQYIEAQVAERGRRINDLSPQELNTLWEAAKVALKSDLE